MAGRQSPVHPLRGWILDATWNPVDDPLAAFEPAGGSLQVSTVVWTDVGQKRQNNEDNFLLFDLYRRTAHPEKAEVTVAVERPGFLLAVADGMGGHQAGQVASQLCVENLPRELLKRLDAGDGSAPTSAALVGAVEDTNRIIFDQASHDPDLFGMGTTLVAALLSDTHVVVALVGDSRAYLLNRGSLSQLTTDQTVANYMAVAQPGLRLDERMGEMLVQAVGAQTRIEVVLTTSTLEPGDVLLLCSDGLYKTVPADDILLTLQTPGSLSTKAEALISLANLNGGPDNVTVLLAEVRQLSEAA
jgi:serine/threonine protein phosphatase PrpC